MTIVAPPESSTVLDRLSRRFPASVVEKRAGFHYLPIDAIIRRFNDVLGFNYSLELDELIVTLVEGETTSTGKQQYRVDAFGHLTVYVPHNGEMARRAGSGSATNFDVDNAVKTAQAEVMKKAGHQFGVGLYLWDELERTLVDHVQSATSGDTLSAYKLAVQTLAAIEGVSPLSAKTIADHFGIAEGDLQDLDALSAILVAADVL